MKTIRIRIVLMILFGSFAIVSCNSAGSKSAKHEHQHEQTDAKEYTCTMHPEVESDEPGDCPKCGMALVEKNVIENTEQEHKHNH